MLRHKKRYVVNFPAHLADCEFNYRRLQRLMPGWRSGLHVGRKGVASKDNTDTDVGADVRNNSGWRYIVGHHKNSEMAVVLDVSEVARYTTSVNIAVHSRLQNQMSWSHYLRYTPQNKKPVLLKPQIPMADIQGSVTMLLNRFKSYSFEVRLYHDASVAEVIAWEGNRRFKARHEYPNPRMYHSDEKAQLNRFLGELLELCLTQGRILDDVTITI
ncbi:MAG: DUF1249 domain-containing protein [Cellvibrionaceae bacterium]